MPALVDSLFLHYRWHDRHVIAFCAGHPDHQAVEAFISHRRGREPLVQAVLTRHDKRQIDYVNDPEVVAAMRATGLREVHPAVFEIDDRSSAHPPRVVLGFGDRHAERFVLDLSAATPALPEFGGLTDPQGHAPGLLPVMWRDRSALAGPDTALTIGGRTHDLVVDPATGGMAAFYTEGFGMGVIAARDPSPRPISSDLVGVETVDGRVRAIRVASSGETASQLVLAFDPVLPECGDAGVDRARFTVAIDDHRGLVTGRVEVGRGGVAIVPEQPAWATSRPIVFTR